MTRVSISDLSKDLSFGSQVEGLDFATLEDETVRQQLRQAFHERGVLVFRNVEPSSKMQVEISKVFGPIKDHPTKTTPRDEETGDAALGVIDMHYIPGDDAHMAGGLAEYQGQVLARFSPWHFDHCYNDELNLAGVLRAPINPPEGGRTGFMDGVECYRQFPAQLREKIEKLNVIYSLDTRLSTMRYGVNFKVVSEDPINEVLLKEAATFPRAMHPAVWTRDSGEKVLHVGPWMSLGIEHYEDPEGDALLDEVCHTINRLGEGTSAYWHEWSDTDMLIWDNHRMLHAVEGCDAKYERQTLRTTIKGDYGLGYFEDGKKVGEVNRDVA